jgi:hypothetical protein
MFRFLKEIHNEIPGHLGFILKQFNIIKCNGKAVKITQELTWIIAKSG